MTAFIVLLPTTNLIPPPAATDHCPRDSVKRSVIQLYRPLNPPLNPALTLRFNNEITLTVSGAPVRSLRRSNFYCTPI